MKYVGMDALSKKASISAIEKQITRMLRYKEYQKDKPLISELNYLATLVRNLK